eukprot:TRINITY_DN3142_c0_g2_i1.p2 TRINITY_DN3142_c0_g2~~TRINITY_DN3142_c0_g2_i1.p2  ORF type:complete len:233 (+),score=33.58 TRINITY_DN3142_c0_g2_i1:672-1370(+)
MPFLRRAALFKRLCMPANESTALTTSGSDFERLCGYLRLPLSIKAYFSSLSGCDTAVNIVKAWEKGGKEDVAFKLYPAIPLRFVPLPAHFEDIFHKYLDRKCARCGTKPKKYSALCLVCGQFLCTMSECCTANKIGECFEHAVYCGAGNGMFLMLRNSAVIILSDEKSCLWGSMYFDRFGEEDMFFSRGKRLVLSEPIYAHLASVFAEHKFEEEILRADVPLYKQIRESKPW